MVPINKLLKAMLLAALGVIKIDAIPTETDVEEAEAEHDAKQDFTYWRNQQLMDYIFNYRTKVSVGEKGNQESPYERLHRIKEEHEKGKDRYLLRDDEALQKREQMKRNAEYRVQKENLKWRVHTIKQKFKSDMVNYVLGDKNVLINNDPPWWPENPTFNPLGLPEATASYDRDHLLHLERQKSKLVQNIDILYKLPMETILDMPAAESSSGIESSDEEDEKDTDDSTRDPEKAEKQPKKEPMYVISRTG